MAGLCPFYGAGTMRMRSSYFAGPVPSTVAMALQR
jgi:hypothetical protein